MPTLYDNNAISEMMGKILNVRVVVKNSKTMDKSDRDKITLDLNNLENIIRNRGIQW
jgi:hypothetical protein